MIAHIKAMAVLIAVLVLALMQAGPAAAQSYEIIDLGTLGGSSGATGINNQGVVVGWSQVEYSPGMYQYHAFVWQGGQMTDLGGLPCSEFDDEARAYAINDAGQIAGVSRSIAACAGCTGCPSGWGLCDTNGGGRPTLWPGPADIGLPKCRVMWMYCDLYWGTALGINNSGVVVGHSILPESSQNFSHAFRWSGTMTDMGTLPDHISSMAHDINDLGDAVGYSNELSLGSFAVIWRGGGAPESLPSLNGQTHGRDSRAYAINNSGIVVGEAWDGARWCGVYWDENGDIHNLGIGVANDVNELGEIVGATVHGTLYKNGTFYDLLSLIPAGTGWTNLHPTAINDAGQIAGQGSINGETHAFFLYPMDTYAITGQVTDEEGIPVADVAVSADSGESAVTGAGGGYTLTVSEDGSYTITPDKAGYTFDPPSRMVTVPPDATGQDFIAAAEPTTYSISGQVLDPDGFPVQDVTVLCDSGDSAITDASGVYSLTITGEGAYILMPIKNGYTFEPSDRTVDVQDDVTGQDFIALAEPHEFTISGQVLDQSGEPVADVTVSADTGESAVTDEDGSYALEVTGEGTYTITPSRSGYTFEPSSRTVDVLDDVTGQDFTAVTDQPTFFLSGQVLDEEGNSVADVTVSSDSGESAVTDANGNYSLIVTGAGIRTLTAEKEGYTFEPSSRTVEVVDNITGQDFTAMPDPPPAAIQDLMAWIVEERAGEVDLKWTAPGEDGDEGEAADQYDVRYSTEPITENNWDLALQAEGEPEPGNPRSKQEMTLTGLPKGVRWHFAVKTADAEENWSEVSNVCGVLDTGFRESMNGFSFPNYKAEDYTVDHLRALFGNDEVCRGMTPECKPFKWAKRDVKHISTFLLKGHCHGLGVMSLRFFKGMDNPSSFNPAAVTTHDLTRNDLASIVAYYMGVQFYGPVYQPVPWTRTYLEVLDDLFASMWGSAPDPSILAICTDSTYLKCHALIPFAIQWQNVEGGVDYHLWVYDSNFNEHHMSIFIYDNNDGPLSLGWTYYNGFLNSEFSALKVLKTMRAIPLSLHSPPQSEAVEAYGLDDARICLNGSGNLLITDEEKRGLGYRDGELVSEIPEAFASIIYGSLEDPVEPIYILPATGDYTILLDGGRVDSSGEADVTRFGPMCAAWVDGIMVDTTTSDRIDVSQNGRQIAYTPTTDQEVTLALALDEPEVGYLFQINGADTGPDEAVALRVNLDGGIMHYSNKQSGGGTYDLVIERSNAEDEARFDYYNLPICATDTHSVEFGGWGGTGPMTLFVDYGSDGTIDQTWLLENGGSMADQDGDGVPDVADNCPDTPNPDQDDADGNGVGDACEIVAGDLDGDGIVDRDDLNILLSHRNQPASVCPECDLDGDGMITALDARKLVLLCTCPRCVCPPL